MAYMYRGAHKTINECLAHLGFGELKNPDLIHASGLTTKKVLVWLPLLGDQIQYDNRPVDDGKYILERNDNDGVGNNPPADTIIRESSGEGLYTYLGKYRVVFCDRIRSYKIHARIDLDDAEGAVQHSGDVSWLSGFASNESDATAKLQGLIDMAQTQNDNAYRSN
jgi:hypothetical protein